MKINSDNYQDLSEGKAWYYDPATNVLHLTDGYIVPTQFVGKKAMFGIDGDVNPSLIIQVDGACNFIGTYDFGISFVGSGRHSICGNGTLTMNSEKINPEVIRHLGEGETSLTVKDVTINIEVFGNTSTGFLNKNFSEIILDNCEMNIKTSYFAWLGDDGVKPVLKGCFLSDGYFGNNGSVYNKNNNTPLKEVFIKRSVSVVDITDVDEPVIGNVPTNNCTPKTNEYYVASVEWRGEREGGLDFLLPDGYTYQGGETYTVYMRLNSTEGNRFAGKDDITVYVNGKEAEIYSIGSGDYVTIKYTFPELVGRYDLWIGGVQVTDANKDNIDGIGKVKYNPSTKTLSLLDVVITGQGSAYDGTTGYGAGIYSEVDGLTIDVKGANVVLGADEGHGIHLRGNTTIKGEGSIQGKGYIGVYMGSDSADLTVDGNVTLQAEGTTSYGLCGYARTFVGKTQYYTTLTIKGSAIVMAKGELPSVRNWNDLVLNNHAIVSPAGAVWNADNHAVCDASGNPISGEWVVIENKSYIRGDVNGDKSVSIADGVAVLNAMAGQAVSGDPDVNGDGEVTIADFVAVLNIMAGQ